MGFLSRLRSAVSKVGSTLQKITTAPSQIARKAISTGAEKVKSVVQPAKTRAAQIENIPTSGTPYLRTVSPADQQTEFGLPSQSITQQHLTGTSKVPLTASRVSQIEEEHPVASLVAGLALPGVGGAEARAITKITDDLYIAGQKFVSKEGKAVADSVAEVLLSRVGKTIDDVRPTQQGLSMEATKHLDDLGRKAGTGSLENQAIHKSLTGRSMEDVAREANNKLAIKSEQSWQKIVAETEEVGMKVTDGDSPILPSTAKAAEGIADKTKVFTRNTIVNSKTEKVKMSFLSKLASKFKKPHMAIGALLGLGYLGIKAVDMAVNAKGMTLWGSGAEVQEGLGYQYQIAAELGNEQRMAEIKELQNDVVALSQNDNIKSWTIAGNIETAEQKLRLTQIQMDNADEKYGGVDPQQTLLNPPYQSQQWWDQKAAADAIIEQERRDYEESRDERYDEIREENLKYWEEKELRDAELLEEERAYWADKEARDAARAAEERAYWEARRAEDEKAAEERTPSNLRFGLL